MSVFGIIYRKKIYRIYRKELISSKVMNMTEIKYEFIEIKPDDIKYISCIENIAEWLYGNLKNMLENGSYCLAVFDSTKLIAFNLISFGDVYIPLIHYYKKFNNNSAWSEHIWVNKIHRNMDIATQLRMKVFSVLSKKGIKQLYGGCLLCNKVSLKLAQKLDFENIADIEYVRILNLRKWKFRRISDF